MPLRSVVLPPALTSDPGLVVPAIVADAGNNALRRFLEFFAAQLSNNNTRRAYSRAAADFFHWCETRQLRDLKAVSTLHVAAWTEELKRHYAPPTVKQRLAAIRMLFDWLVVGQVVPFNPATAVRGPKHVVKKGKTPVLSTEEARDLFDSIPTDTMTGLRDRALIGILFYTFARIGAAVRMNVEDYFPQGRKMWVRLHEKGGKHHEMPAHHKLVEFLGEYLDAAGIAKDSKGPLFRTVRGRSQVLQDRRLDQRNAWDMVQRRAVAAGISTHTTNHSFRATGITNYLDNGGTLENAQAMAAHADPKTTKLYDRTSDQITLDEIERIRL